MGQWPTVAATLLVCGARQASVGRFLRLRSPVPPCFASSIDRNVALTSRDNDHPACTSVQIVAHWIRLCAVRSCSANVQVASAVPCNILDWLVRDVTAPRAQSHQVRNRSDVISSIEGQPANAIARSNSSRRRDKTSLMPCSPSTTSPQTIGRPI